MMVQKLTVSQYFFDSVHFSQRTDLVQYILFCYLFYHHNFNLLLPLGVISRTIIRSRQVEKLSHRDLDSKDLE